VFPDRERDAPLGSHCACPLAGHVRSGCALAGARARLSPQYACMTSSPAARTPSMLASCFVLRASIHPAASHHDGGSQTTSCRVVLLTSFHHLRPELGPQYSVGDASHTPSAAFVDPFMRGSQPPPSRCTHPQSYRTYEIASLRSACSVCGSFVSCLIPLCYAFLSFSYHLFVSTARIVKLY
jgi:hypothetical protein